MAIKRTFNTKFWSDPEIVENYTPEDRYFYLYLLLNEHTTLCGTLTASPKTIAYEIGYSVDSVRNLIERHEKIHQTIRYDSEYSEILILKWCRYNWTTSDKLITSIRGQLKDVCSPTHKALIEELLEKVLENEPLDTLSIPYRYPIDTSLLSISKSVSISNKNKGRKKSKKEFIPPTFEDVMEYAIKRNRSDLAQTFYDYYTAPDEGERWKDKDGKQIESWKQKFISWEGRNKPDKTGSKPINWFEVE